MKCPKHPGRGRPPADCRECAGLRLVEPTRLPKGPSAPVTTVEQEAEALQKRIERALTPRQTAVIPESDSQERSNQPKKLNPAKCPQHQVGRPPKQCSACDAARAKLPTAEAVQKPVSRSEKPAKEAAERRGKPAQKDRPKTPAQIRQDREAEAHSVLSALNSMGMGHRCYDCPHGEEDHQDGVCRACWDERIKRHPFRSFLAGANSYFAKQSLAAATATVEVTADESD